MKDYSYVALMDIYGKALTDKQRNMLSDYYDRDYSLSEIADNYSVSRQAVHFAIKQAEDSLREAEEKFGIHSFITDLCARIEEIKSEPSENAVRKLSDLEEFVRSYYGTV